MTLKINGSTAGSVSIDAPADTSPTGTDVTLTLPTSAGTNGQYLQTNGSGTLSWQTNVSFPDAIDVNASAPADSVNIDSSGNLGIGTSSPDDLLHLSASNTGIGNDFTLANNLIRFEDTDVTQATSQVIGGLLFEGQDSDTNAAGLQAALTANVASGSGGGEFRFHTSAASTTSPTERMRLRSTGQTWLVGDTNQLAHFFIEDSADGSNLLFRAGHSATGIDNGSGTQTFRILDNGNVANSNNSYGSLSDVKLKENIVDASSQWDDLKAIQVRNYNFKEETGQQTHTQLGVVAQEIELVSPGLVSESPDRDEDGNDLGTVTKSVNYSVLYMKAVKALQEAMERIESLETRITALEGGAA